MKRSIVAFGASACLVTLLGAATPAHAAIATFVSGDGNDGALCTSPATACRQISAAIPKTDTFGVVHVLPGSYNAFVVDRLVHVVADEGPVVVAEGSGTIPAISVTAGGGIAVQLKGLQVSAYIGIVFTGQGTLVIEDCTIQFGSLPVAYGIDFRPAGGASFM
jgi:hypothetical protein